MYALAFTLIGPLSACDRNGLAENRTQGDVGINYIVRGSGQPVVLVHGFSQSHEAWLQTPLFEDLKRDHRIIAVDLRGHGDSGKPQDPRAYGRYMEADLIELLDRLDMDKAHFVGFSMGAEVLIIEGADHDSAKAAVFSDEFSRAVRRFITSHPIS